MLLRFMFLIMIETCSINVPDQYSSVKMEKPFSLTMKTFLGKIVGEKSERGEEIKHQVRGFLLEICSITNIHGIRYFTESRRHWTERLWWIVAVALSMYFCGSSIREILVNWHENPVKMELTDKPVSISKIPFPAVTICSTVIADSNKVNANSLEEFIQRAQNSSEEPIRAQGHAAATICNRPFKNVTQKLANGNILGKIQEISQSPSEAFHTVRWKMKDINPNENFVSILTNYGRCFTFNSLNQHEMFTKGMTGNLAMAENNPNILNWDPDDGYDFGVAGERYPRHISSILPGSSLKIVFRESKNDSMFKCSNWMSTFRIYLTMSGEHPFQTRALYQIYPEGDTKISITAKSITTSHGLRSYTPDQRQCYFNSERRLKFFQVYTQSNCNYECFTEYMRLKCGCVLFIMPVDNNQTDICVSLKLLDCDFFNMANQFYEDIDDVTDEDAKIFRKKCNCLPSCTTILYDGEMERNQFHSKSSADNIEQELSKIYIHFKEHEVTSMKRMELYTFENMLAIGGGLLGLFLGISLLSIVEIIYYFTLRLFWNIRQWKRNRVQPNRSMILPVISIDITN